MPARQGSSISAKERKQQRIPLKSARPGTFPTDYRFGFILLSKAASSLDAGYWAKDSRWLTDSYRFESHKVEWIAVLDTVITIAISVTLGVEMWLDSGRDV